MTLLSVAGYLIPALIYAAGSWYLHRVVLMFKHSECPTCRKLGDSLRRLGGKS